MTMGKTATFEDVLLYLLLKNSIFDCHASELEGMTTIKIFSYLLDTFAQTWCVTTLADSMALPDLMTSMEVSRNFSAPQENQKGGKNKDFSCDKLYVFELDVKTQQTRRQANKKPLNLNWCSYWRWCWSCCLLGLLHRPFIHQLQWRRRFWFDSTFMLRILLTFRRTRLLNLNLFQILFWVNEPPIINVCHPLQSFFQERRISSWSFLTLPLEDDSNNQEALFIAVNIFRPLEAWLPCDGDRHQGGSRIHLHIVWRLLVSWLWYIYVKTLRRLKVRYFTHTPCITIETNQLFTIFIVILLKKKHSAFFRQFCEMFETTSIKTTINVGAEFIWMVDIETPCMCTSITFPGDWIISKLEIH